jgi:hypothetical protein
MQRVSSGWETARRYDELILYAYDLRGGGTLWSTYDTTDTKKNCYPCGVIFNQASTRLGRIERLQKGTIENLSTP